MNPRKLVEIITEKCKQAPERAPDYHKALLEKVSDVVWAEYQHAIRATTIQKTVTDACESLGDYIMAKGTEAGSK